MSRFATKGTATTADKAAVKFCILDLLPFEVLAGDEMRVLLQEALDFGLTSKSRLLVADLMAHSTTVTRNVQSQAAQGRKELEGIIRAHLNSGVYGAHTMDMWTDLVKKLHGQSPSIT